MLEAQIFIAWSIVMLGIAFILLASIGIYKFPDTLTRMAAGSKASTLGMMLAVLGAMIHPESAGARLALFFGLIMVLLTSPVAAHLLGRAAIRAGLRVFPQTQNTELLKDLRRGPHPEETPPPRRT